MLALPAYTAHVGHLSTLQMERLDEFYTPREVRKASTRNKQKEQQARETARQAELPSTSGGHVTSGEFDLLWVHARCCG
jgi:hypothetical protein